MSKNGIRVEEFNIFSLGAEAVSYPQKDIHTLALRVTEENIGGLSLELEVELCYFNDGVPFLEVYLARGTKDEPETDRWAQVKVGDWFVILWDEIHVFRDKEFSSTFTFEGFSAPGEKEMMDYVEQDAKKTMDLFNHKTAETSDKMLEALRRKLNEEVPMDDAERTEIVPAVGELDEGFEVTRGEHPIAGVAREIQQ